MDRPSRVYHPRASLSKQIAHESALHLSNTGSASKRRAHAPIAASPSIHSTFSHTLIAVKLRHVHLSTERLSVCSVPSR
eukprot:6179867-Pleurochrysis_carterae.AAC.1